MPIVDHNLSSPLLPPRFFAGGPEPVRPAPPSSITETIEAGFNLYNPFKMVINSISEQLGRMGEPFDPNYDPLKHIPEGYEEYVRSFLDDSSDAQIARTRASIDEELRNYQVLTNTTWPGFFANIGANVAMNPFYWFVPVKGATTLASIGKSALNFALQEAATETTRHLGLDTITAKESIGLVASSAFIGGIAGGIFMRVRKTPEQLRRLGYTEPRQLPPPPIYGQGTFEIQPYVKGFGYTSDPLKITQMDIIAKEMGVDNFEKLINAYPTSHLLQMVHGEEIRGVIRALDDAREAMDDLLTGRTWTTLREPVIPQTKFIPLRQRKWETTLDDFKVQDETGFHPIKDDPSIANTWATLKQLYKTLDEERMELERRIAEAPPESVNRAIKEEVESIEKKIKNNEYEANYAEAYPEVNAELLAEKNKALADTAASLEGKKIPIGEALEANGLKTLDYNSPKGLDDIKAVKLDDDTIIYFKNATNHADIQARLEKAGIDSEHIADTGLIVDDVYYSWEYAYLEMDEFGNFTEARIPAASEQEARNIGTTYEMKTKKRLRSGVVRKAGEKTEVEKFTPTKGHEIMGENLRAMKAAKKAKAAKSPNATGQMERDLLEMSVKDLKFAIDYEFGAEAVPKKQTLENLRKTYLELKRK